MSRRPIEQGVYVPNTVLDLVEVLSCKSVPHDPEWYKLREMVDQKGFSISQMKEYQPDLWNWVVRASKIYWKDKQALH